MTQTNRTRTERRTVRTLAARDAKTHFADLMRSAQSEPVMITKNGKPAMIAVSPEHYESLAGQRRQRFLENTRKMRQMAQDRGLTEAKLNEILTHLDD